MRLVSAFWFLEMSTTFAKPFLWTLARQYMPGFFLFLNGDSLTNVSVSYLMTGTKCWGPSECEQTNANDRSSIPTIEDLYLRSFVLFLIYRLWCSDSRRSLAEDEQRPCLGSLAFPIMSTLLRVRNLRMISCLYWTQHYVLFYLKEVTRSFSVYLHNFML